MNLSGLEVVKADPSDVDELQFIGERTFFESYSSQNTEEDIENYLSEKFNTQSVLSELNNPESEFYLVKREQNSIGYLKLNFGNAQTDIKDQSSMEIERIYILKNYQGNKIGEILYSKALEIAAARKASYIWLGVWEKNLGAIRFYNKLGFIEFDRHVFTLGSDRQTDIMMKLELGDNN